MIQFSLEMVSLAFVSYYLSVSSKKRNLKIFWVECLVNVLVLVVYGYWLVV